MCSVALTGLGVAVALCVHLITIHPDKIREQKLHQQTYNTPTQGSPTANHVSPEDDKGIFDSKSQHIWHGWQLDGADRQPSWDFKARPSLGCKDDFSSVSSEFTPICRLPTPVTADMTLGQARDHFYG